MSEEIKKVKAEELKGRITTGFLGELASAVNKTIEERVGNGVGFVLIAVDEASDGSTDFQYISNIPDEAAIKELMTQVVTHNETQN